MNYYKVLLVEGAQRDIHLAKNWQAQNNPYLGEKLTDELGRIFLHLEKHAQEYPIASFGRFRKVAIPRVPFTLVYKIFDGQTVILGMAHEEYLLKNCIK